MCVQFVVWGMLRPWRMVLPCLKISNSIPADNNQGKHLKTVADYFISVYYIYIDPSLLFLCSVMGLVTIEEIDAYSPFKKSIYDEGKGKNDKKNVAPVFLTQLHFFTINEEGVLKPSFFKGR